MSSDITAEAADAVILEASLGKVDELMHIGQAYAFDRAPQRCGRDGAECDRDDCRRDLVCSRRSKAPSPRKSSIWRPFSMRFVSPFPFDHMTDF